MNLLRIILILLSSVVVSFNIYTQFDYHKYFRQSNELKYKLFIGDTVTYRMGYNTICENDNYPFDYFDYAKMYYFFNKDTSIFLFKKAINCGYELESMVYYFEELRGDKTFLDILEKEQENFNKRINIYYSKTLKEMAQLDQKSRIDYNHNSEDEHYKYVEKIDKENLLKLKKMIDSLGWPSYKEVGVSSSGDAFLIVLHGLRQFKTDSEMTLYFKQLLMNEIAKGDFCPLSFANLFDQLNYLEGKLQVYGSLADSDNYLLPHIDKSLIDINRYQIGLNPLEQYLKTNYIRTK